MKKTEKEVLIKAPNMESVTLRIQGTAPLVQARFAKKAELMETMRQGSQAKSKRKKEPKDFESLCDEAVHYSTDGWVGIPASAFRAGMISACRLVGFKMTLAKLSVFVEADGYDADGMPLIKLDAGDYEQVEHYVRNATGVVDIRSRPMWKKWGADVRIRYDADQFSVSDVSNLLARVGMQVGIGEGRPDSKSSPGLGWGTFELTAG